MWYGIDRGNRLTIKTMSGLVINVRKTFLLRAVGSRSSQEGEPVLLYLPFLWRSVVEETARLRRRTHFLLLFKFICTFRLRENNLVAKRGAWEFNYLAVPAAYSDELERFFNDDIHITLMPKH